MTFDEAVAVLRGWAGERVVVRLEPETSVMEGPLCEREGGGPDCALFAVVPLSGVAVALFRDGVRSVALDGDQLVVEQGQVTLTVTRAA